MTDVSRVEQFLRSTQGVEFNHRRIVDDMHITEYSGRISDVRKLWGCTCGKNKLTCTAIEHVQNTRKGWYRYVHKKLHYEARVIKPQVLTQTLVDKASQAPEKAQKLSGEALRAWERTRAMLGKTV